MADSNSNNVVYATFGVGGLPDPPDYDEALFRQALNQEMLDNGGHLTEKAIEDAYLRTVEVAVIYKEEDPDQLNQFVGITLALLERERDIVGENWSP